MLLFYLKNTHVQSAARDDVKLLRLHIRQQKHTRLVLSVVLTFEATIQFKSQTAEMFL